MSRTLMQAYLNSSYTFQEVTLQLQDTPGEAQVPFPPVWGMLTAYNPQSMQLTARDNQQRHQRLTEEIRSMGLVPEDYIGGEGEWTEPGCLVRNLTLRQTLDLGQQFDQNAVLWGSGNRVALVWVTPLLITRHWFAAQGNP